MTKQNKSIQYNGANDSKKNLRTVIPDPNLAFTIQVHNCKERAKSLVDYQITTSLQTHFGLYSDEQLSEFCPFKVLKKLTKDFGSCNFANRGNQSFSVLDFGEDLQNVAFKQLEQDQEQDLKARFLQRHEGMDNHFQQNIKINAILLYRSTSDGKSIMCNQGIDKTEYKISALPCHGNLQWGHNYTLFDIRSSQQQQQKQKFGNMQSKQGNTMIMPMDRININYKYRKTPKKNEAISPEESINYIGQKIKKGLLQLSSKEISEFEILKGKMCTIEQRLDRIDEKFDRLQQYVFRSLKKRKMNLKAVKKLLSEI